MFYIVRDDNGISHGPFRNKKTAALWAVDNCGFPVTVESVMVPKGAEEYAHAFEQSQNLNA